MVKKRLLLGTLIVFALIMLAMGITASQAGATGATVPRKAIVKEQSRVIVYYFYGKPRCVSCQKIESWTQQAVSAMNRPDVEFKMINFDQPENKHYLQDYGLYTKSVVLSKVKGEQEVKSKNLPDIWTKLSDEQGFKRYIIEEIKQMMEN